MNAKEELKCTNLCPMINFVCLCLLFFTFCSRNTDGTEASLWQMTSEYSYGIALRHLDCCSRCTALETRASDPPPELTGH